MQIAAVEKVSLNDYPGEVAYLIYTQGCNFLCRFCYNGSLIPKYKGEGVPEEIVLDELARRKKLLTAISITGGEPTLQSDLREFIRKVKKMGYKTKFDTNGSQPQVLEKLLDPAWVDFVAMDFKASPACYSQIIGTKIDFSKIRKSVDLIQNYGKDYEFRTTLVPGFHDEDMLHKIGEELKGCQKWVLQNIYPLTKLVDKELEEIVPFSDKEMKAFRKIGKEYVSICEIR